MKEVSAVHSLFEWLRIKAFSCTHFFASNGVTELLSIPVIYGEHVVLTKVYHENQINVPATRLGRLYFEVVEGSKKELGCAHANH